MAQRKLEAETYCQGDWQEEQEVSSPFHLPISSAKPAGRGENGVSKVPAAASQSRASEGGFGAELTGQKHVNAESLFS